MAKTLEELDRELWATQIWLRELFIYAAGSASEARTLAGYVRERIKGMKNAPPPEGMGDAFYDRLTVAVIPHLEEIGTTIANTLDSSADLADAAASGQPR